MTARQGTGLTLAAAAAFLMFCAGCLWPFQIGFDIAAGWAFFLARVVPLITVNVNGMLTGIVALLSFVAGLHLLLRWLYGAMATDSPENTSRRWQFRWTLGLTGLVVVMFAAGIATVGSLHQVGWLVTSPQPLIDGGLRPIAARIQSANNLKQIALALHNFNDTHQGRLPPGYTTDRWGQPLHGWQAQILPYIEHESVYQVLHFDRPWDAPENRPALQTSIPEFLYRYPDLPKEDGGYALSHYAGNVRVFPPTAGLRLPADFTDGTSNTLFAGEVSVGFRPWGHPLNLRDPGRGLHRSADAFLGPWSGDITQFVLADGSVRPVRNTISPTVLKALATPAGGEDVSGANW
jgi:Protein of unknown function (DUF1559)